MILSFCCLCTRDVPAPLIRFGDGSLPREEAFNISNMSKGFAISNIFWPTKGSRVTEMFLTDGLASHRGGPKGPMVRKI